MTPDRKQFVSVEHESNNRILSMQMHVHNFNAKNVSKVLIASLTLSSQQPVTLLSNKFSIVMSTPGNLFSVNPSAGGHYLL